MNKFQASSGSLIVICVFILFCNTFMRNSKGSVQEFTSAMLPDCRGQNTNIDLQWITFGHGWNTSVNTSELEARCCQREPVVYGHEHRFRKVHLSPSNTHTAEGHFNYRYISVCVATLVYHCQHHSTFLRARMQAVGWILGEAQNAFTGGCSLNLQVQVTRTKIQKIRGVKLHSTRDTSAL